MFCLQPASCTCADKEDLFQRLNGPPRAFPLSYRLTTVTSGVSQITNLTHELKLYCKNEETPEN